MGLHRLKVFYWMMLLLLMANVGCVSGGLLGVWDPSQLATKAIKEAEQALEAARAAGAEEVVAARYEFYRAEAYLSLARDELGHPHFSGARHYAEVAKETAERALALAQGR